MHKPNKPSPPKLLLVTVFITGKKKAKTWPRTLLETGLSSLELLSTPGSGINREQAQILAPSLTLGNN